MTNEEMKNLFVFCFIKELRFEEFLNDVLRVRFIAFFERRAECSVAISSERVISTKLFVNRLTIFTDIKCQMFPKCEFTLKISNFLHRTARPEEEHDFFFPNENLLQTTKLCSARICMFS